MIASLLGSFAFVAADVAPLAADASKPWTWHPFVLVLIGGVFNGVGQTVHKNRRGTAAPALAFMSGVGLARMWGSLGILLALQAVLPFPPFSYVRPSSGEELLLWLAMIAVVAALLVLWGRLTRPRTAP